MTRTWLIWLAVVNPARAGMIPMRGTPSGCRSCKPRASGDDPMPSFERKIAVM